MTRWNWQNFNVIIRRSYCYQCRAKSAYISKFEMDLYCSHISQIRILTLSHIQEICSRKFWKSINKGSILPNLFQMSSASDVSNASAKRLKDSSDKPWAFRSDNMYTQAHLHLNLSQLWSAMFLKCSFRRLDKMEATHICSRDTCTFVSFLLLIRPYHTNRSRAWRETVVTKFGILFPRLITSP